VQHLSDEWFQAVERSLAEVRLEGDRHVAVRQEVVGGPTYTLVIDGGSARLDRSEDAPADVTLRCDVETSTRLAQGELSVPAAVLAGRLLARGDVTVLLDAADALEVVAGAVRRATAAGGALSATGTEAGGRRRA
jgi:putative sterol carrier protein